MRVGQGCAAFRIQNVMILVRHLGYPQRLGKGHFSLRRAVAKTSVSGLGLPSCGGESILWHNSSGEEALNGLKKRSTFIMGGSMFVHAMKNVFVCC